MRKAQKVKKRRRLLQKEEAKGLEDENREGGKLPTIREKAETPYDKDLERRVWGAPGRDLLSGATGIPDARSRKDVDRRLPRCYSGLRRPTDLDAKSIPSYTKSFMARWCRNR